jgi:hypothetical protein
MTVSKNKDGAQALIRFMADPANAALVRQSHGTAGAVRH